MVKPIILIIEDETAIVAYLQTELKFEDYIVLTASDGEMGLSVFEQNSNRINVVLLDWMLPKRDGLEVLRRIRKLNSQVSIILMTAKSDIGDKVAALDSGADDYITKPFEIEELLARLRVTIRHQNKPRPRLYQISNLVLDLDAHRVTRDDQVIDLTQREFQLLTYLIENAGKTLTRDDLLDNVWGVDFNGQYNTADVYIRYLRQKIDDHFYPKLIHTVRSVGYVLRAK
ncbi:two-component response regulator [YkoH] [Oenococcus oeni]|uniref:response regulator transcription factor n=1 Tax=Oenococcus oeni TaxID=1247 RepID=UPI0008F8708E|nr:response regulator transcription factor [Oenococcus oeni]MDN6968515.1 response regulator transcription factor [Oenococcus sp. UCMA 17063]AVI95012.1 PhoB family transcriptional regulator [Oenococcus oeni]OIM27226.1 DNA-binding response regulator [Oenococcus oeni]SYW01394.1 two-component response regulator (YkoH) [Oenococcus oeni]SYW01969.1 two-component response regulator (YkoH) [Oenococcus oeni]